MNSAKEFWDWFKENNTSYFFLSSVDEDVKEQLLNKFLERLHKYCDQIYFEIGGYPEEDQELIITAEGNIDYFDKVEELISNAPNIKRWTFIAFKPPMPEHFKSSWDDVELNTEEMWFQPLRNNRNSELGIRIFIPNHDLVKDNEILTPLLYKMLDTILGEKSFALDISYVDTDQLPDEPEEQGLYPILELPEYVNNYKSRT